jgi:hypothetical protein
MGFFFNILVGGGRQGREIKISRWQSGWQLP